jgi:hypothetical protein
MAESHSGDPVYSFHGGPPLNVWERCSLQSFADHGHEIVLFSYDQIDVPRGVRLQSAADIVSIEARDKFFALAPDLYSQFSDFFRYQLLHQRGGWWVDTDVLCRSPTLPSQPVVVGETRPGKLCGAIMRFPPAHPLLQEALDYSRDHQRSLSDAHRTVIGPILLSDLIKSHPIAISERHLFFPLRAKDVWRFGEPSNVPAVEREVEASPMVHWFQEFFRAAGLPRDLLPPASSYLANAFVTHGGAGERHISLDEYRAYAPGGKKRNVKRKIKKKQAPRRGLLRSLWNWVRGGDKRSR